MKPLDRKRPVSDTARTPHEGTRLGVTLDLPKIDASETQLVAAPIVAYAPRLLVVDADEAARQHVVALGREHYVRTDAADGCASALEMAHNGEHFDLVFIDVMLPPTNAAFGLARSLRALPGYERVPIAFLADGSNVAHRVAAAHAGGSLYLAKPLDAYTFGASVEQLLALGEARHARVLVIDDDEDFSLTVASILGLDGMLVTVLTDTSRILDVMDEESPDLVLLDVTMPNVNGFDIARMLRTTPRWQDVPILFLTGRSDVDTRVAAFEAGGDDYLAKPIAENELLARVRARLERRRLFREMTEKDPVTHVLSRRSLVEALAGRLSESRRHGRQLSVALLDLDQFKRVNDTYGHTVGDQVLATLGRLLGERFRLEDLRGRWGGEEFVIVFPGEAVEMAAEVLRRVLTEFANISFRGDHGDAFHVSFSAGVASFPEDGTTIDTLLKAADLRLYQAKAAGRNRVVSPVVSPDETDVRYEPPAVSV